MALIEVCGYLEPFARWITLLCHLIIEAVPNVSVNDCALALLNNTQQWMEKRYWGVLKETGAWEVWQPSFYAGTVGEYSTAQVKRFLGGS